MSLHYLDKKDVIYINQRTIAAHGGNFTAPNNFLHEENLDYLLEAVQSKIFNEPLYPSIADKAAVYCYNIICNHIFSDGNERTGLEAALAFLKLNGFRLDRSLPNEDLLAFIIKVASGQSSLEECRTWFAANITSLK